MAKRMAKVEEKTKKKKPVGRIPKPKKKTKAVEPVVEETKAVEEVAKKKPGRPKKETRGRKPVGRIPKPKKKTKAVEPAVEEDKASDISFGDLLFVADDLNNCLEPDPLIDADDDTDEEELRKAILDTAELLTDEDIIASKAFPKGTSIQNRMDTEGGGPYLAIETLELLQKLGVELPESLADVKRGGTQAEKNKRAKEKAALRERMKAEIQAKMAEEDSDDEDDEDEDEEEMPKKGKKKRYTRVNSLVDAIKMGPCTKKELAERANMLYMEHGGTDSLVHAKWYVTGIAQVIKELGVDVYTTKR